MRMREIRLLMALHALNMKKFPSHEPVRAKDPAFIPPSKGGRAARRERRKQERAQRKAEKQ